MIDVNRDREGLQVLVDLQGGNPDDPVAMAVFEEIRDTVMTDVRHFPLERTVDTNGNSDDPENRERTQRCGENINGVYYLRCPRRRLRSS